MRHQPGVAVVRAAQPFDRGFAIDEGGDDVAGVGGVLAADRDDVAVTDRRLGPLPGQSGEREARERLGGGGGRGRVAVGEGQGLECLRVVEAQDAVRPAGAWSLPRLSERGLIRFCRAPCVTGCPGGERGQDGGGELSVVAGQPLPGFTRCFTDAAGRSAGLRSGTCCSGTRARRSCSRRRVARAGGRWRIPSARGIS